MLLVGRRHTTAGEGAQCCSEGDILLLERKDKKPTCNTTP